jgi:hypothetical protein
MKEKKRREVRTDAETNRIGQSKDGIDKGCHRKGYLGLTGTATFNVLLHRRIPTGEIADLSERKTLI